MAEWLTAATIGTVWSQAPAEPLRSLLVNAAKEQVIEAGMILVDGVRTKAATALAADPPATLPDRLVIAQGMQARAIWESQKSNVGGDVDAIGLENFQVRVYSMAKPVRDLCDPLSPIMGIG